MGHHVGPENFYPPNVSTKTIMNDSVSRIQDGNGTLRDYARVIATRDFGDDGGLFMDDERLNTDSARNMLRQGTDEIVSDPRFQGFVEKSSKEELLEMMKGDAEEFCTAWNAYKEINPLTAESSEKTDETPSPETSI